ncbi:hypothetical protein [Bradyrhizobium sp. UFLA05-153]
MADLKRDMAILATSGSDWSERTKRLASRVPDLDIFSQGLVDRLNGGWRITDKGRAVLALMEARPAAADEVNAETTRGQSRSSGGGPAIPGREEPARSRTPRTTARRPAASTGQCLLTGTPLQASGPSPNARSTLDLSEVGHGWASGSKA